MTTFLDSEIDRKTDKELRTGESQTGGMCKGTLASAAIFTQNVHTVISVHQR